MFFKYIPFFNFVLLCGLWLGLVWLYRRIESRIETVEEKVRKINGHSNLT